MTNRNSYRFKDQLPATNVRPESLTWKQSVIWVGKMLIIRYIKKYIVPFIVFSFMGFIIGIISSVITGNSIISLINMELWSFAKHGSTCWNAPLWFLISLFFVRLFFYYARRVNVYFLLFFLLMFAQLHKMFLANRGLWWMGNFFSGFVFYILGFKFKELQYHKVTLLLSIATILIVGLLRPTIVTMFGNFILNDKGIYLLWYPFCLAGIVVFNNFLIYFHKVFKFYNFETVGKYSVVFYVVHYPLGLLICNLFKPADGINNYQLIFILCLVWLLFIPLLVYFFNTQKMSKFIGK